jgi:hypothetical protein
MLVSKENLLGLIGQIARSAAESLSLRIEQDAVQRLQTPTPDFASQEQFDIGEPELLQSVREIIVSASRIARRSDRNAIRRSDVDEALSTYPCHLLWLC